MNVKQLGLSNNRARIILTGVVLGMAHTTYPVEGERDDRALHSS